jgi:hypothetical protein
MNVTTTWTSSGGSKNSISTLVYKNHIELSYTITLASGEPENLRYPVELTWTSCNYGGKRPWFICPGRNCGRRVGKLYLGYKYFLCRHCNNLTYESRRNSISDRLADKAHKIRSKLGGEPGFQYPFPDKPKGMHWKTYIRLKNQATIFESLSWIETAKQFGIDLGKQWE